MRKKSLVTSGQATTSMQKATSRGRTFWIWWEKSGILYGEFLQSDEAVTVNHYQQLVQIRYR